MRWWWMALWVVVVAGCDVRDAFTGKVRVVARAGEHELAVERFAAILAQSQRVPLRRDIVERWAHRWVDFALFANRLAAGDSLLDSATVLYARWPHVHGKLERYFRDMLIAERLQVDTAVIDSAYAAGDHRLIQHILIRTGPDKSPAEVEAAEQRAAALRAQVMTGTPWERAAESSEDLNVRHQDGGLGLISRGQMLPAFEQSAFSLAPGQVSPVTKSAFGFHIIRRPELSEVRDEYQEAIEDLLAARLDSAYAKEVIERWQVKVRSGAPAAMREAAAAPLVALESRKVLATYRRGNFTVGDLIGWLQALPRQMHLQISVANDQQLVEFANSLIRSELIVREAREAGMKLTRADYVEQKGLLRADIDEVRVRLGLDPALAGALTWPEQVRAIDEALERYLTDFFHTFKNATEVTAFLGRKLRAEDTWEVSAAGLDRVVERAIALRAELESSTMESEGEARRGNDGL